MAVACEVLTERRGWAKRVAGTPVSARGTGRPTSPGPSRRALIYCNLYHLRGSILRKTSG